MCAMLPSGSPEGPIVLGFVVTLKEMNPGSVAAEFFGGLKPTNVLI
jgi:hypothetical protein